VRSRTARNALRALAHSSPVRSRTVGAEGNIAARGRAETESDMNRRTFVVALSAAVIPLRAAAQATGSAEIDGALQGRLVRVLLASGDTIATPKQLDAWHFEWTGRTYRGGYAFVPLPGGRKGLINLVPLDEYLHGVISSELSPDWPRATLEAQAIVARTYVVSKMQPDKMYDVIATDSDQRYGAIASESAEGRAAVDSTAGTIVAYNGGPASTAFSACCGGRTADPKDVWGSALPYLKSFVDPHCVGTPDYRWAAIVSYGAVQRALDLTRAGTLRAVELKNLTPSGRPRSIVFEGSASTVEVATGAFRVAAGTTLVRSTFLRNVSAGPDGLSISGNGSGHGVGMCQWGARRMADKGALAADIVAFYFPNTTLKRV
jgi:stage II sporulation protein D